MKRYLFVVFFLTIIPMVVNAQDLITKKDGTDIEAKVLEVSSACVKYVKTSSPEGPTFTLDTSEILMIRFADGEKQLFNNNNQNQYSYSDSYVSRPDRPYSLLRQQYNPQDYLPGLHDQYTPGLMGLASFFIPGLGQGICGEWGRACIAFFGYGTLTTLGTTFTLLGIEDDSTGMVSGGVVSLAGAIGLYIWSICDSVSIAKVKNMYYNDESYPSLSLKIEPSFALVPSSPNIMQPTYGLSMKVSF